MQKKNAALDKKVRGAIKQLIADGKPVTNANVREVTGGSFRDLGPIIKEIKAELEAAAQASQTTPDMPEEVVEATAEMWRIAWEKADEASAAERRGHAALVAKLQAEVAERESDVGTVEDERDEAQELVMRKQREVAELTEKLREAELEIASLKGRLAEREDMLSRRDAAPGTLDASDEKPSSGEIQVDMFPQINVMQKQPGDPEQSAAE